MSSLSILPLLWGKEDKIKQKHNFDILYFLEMVIPEFFFCQTSIYTYPMGYGGGGELDQNAHSNISLCLLGLAKTSCTPSVVTCTPSI